MTSIASGQMINDHVRLIRPLAHGAMGNVWVARHENLNIDVAVKLIAAGLNQNNVAIERFRREAQCAARMRSRHVVQVFDHGGQESGLAYIVMELLDGQTLMARLKARKQLPVSEVTQLVQGVAAALTEAHRHNIIHRDLKPANVFMAREGSETVVKLLDFGVAKSPNARGQKTLTEAGMLIGSPQYMSPEQLLNAKTVDHSCDLWALAAIAYRALVGFTPFPGERISDIALAILEREIITPSSRNPLVGPALDDWFATSLHKKAARRFPSAQAMAHAFEQAAAAPRDADTADDVEPVTLQPTRRPRLDSEVTTMNAWPSDDEDEATLDDNASVSQETPPDEPSQPRRWALTERIPPEQMREARQALAAAPTVGDSLAPPSHTRPRAAAGGSFQSGRYVRFDRAAGQLDSGESFYALESPRSRMRRTASWLLLCVVIAVAAIAVIGSLL